MKLISIFIILWLLTSSSMQADFTTTESKVTIEITRDKMTIQTILPYWSVEHHIILNKGLNVGYYVLHEKQSFRYEIINY